MIVTRRDGQCLRNTAYEGAAERLSARERKGWFLHLRCIDAWPRYFKHSGTGTGLGMRILLARAQLGGELGNFTIGEGWAPAEFIG